MVSLLVENMSTEEINQPGFGGCTPLHIAVFHGFLPVVSVLASHGASLIVSSKHSEEHGLRTPNEGINQRYLKNWADVADKMCFGRT